jgi:flagellar biosynthetic protein FliQ
MGSDVVLDIGRQAVMVTLMISAPFLLVALGIGLIVSVFQAATQINEPSLSFIPKLVGLLLTLIVGGPWILSSLMDYTRHILKDIPLLSQ